MVKQTINVVSRQSKAKESRFVMHKIHRQQPSKRVGKLRCPKSNNGKLNRAMKATSKSIMKVQRVCSILSAGDLLKLADNSLSNATKGEQLAILQPRKNESSRKRSKDVSHGTSD